MNMSDELTRRIAALIPRHPEILSMDSPWRLFKVQGFVCEDLNPTLAQAAEALIEAQRCYRPVTASDTLQ